eukprot:2219250-Pleurochrysis_carterae.AAC.1
MAHTKKLPSPASVEMRSLQGGTASILTQSTDSSGMSCTELAKLSKKVCHSVRSLAPKRVGIKPMIVFTFVRASSTLKRG